MKRNLIGAIAALFIIIAGVYFVYGKIEQLKPEPIASGQSMKDGASAAAKLSRIVKADGLSGARLNEALNEWTYAPHGPIAPEAMKATAERELPEPPQDAADLCLELERMFKGDVPFTKAHATAIAYYSDRLDPRIPLPDLPEDPEGGDDMKRIYIHKAYQAFRQYVAVTVTAKNA